MTPRLRHRRAMLTERAVLPSTTGDVVGELARFYGIIVRIHTRGEHPPPHFHAIYAEQEALIAIDDGELVAGSLPPRARRLVEEWRRLHIHALRRNWDLAQAQQPHEPIEPLE